MSPRTSMLSNSVLHNLKIWMCRHTSVYKHEHTFYVYYRSNKSLGTLPFLDIWEYHADFKWMLQFWENGQVLSNCTDGPRRLQAKGRSHLESKAGCFVPQSRWRSAPVSCVLRISRTHQDEHQHVWLQFHHQHQWV